jgi:hypothetical protein
MLAKAIKLISVSGLRLKSCVIADNEEGEEKYARASGVLVECNRGGN